MNLNRPMLSGFILGACALVLALGAQAAGNTTSSTGATAEKASASDGATSNHATASQHSAHQHSRHHAAHASGHKHPAHTTAAAPASSQDAAYQTALRSCVEGPAGQRDSCLDGAISRFGRS